MNGRTLLSVPSWSFAAALAAASFAVAPHADARPQGETPAAPAPGTGSPTSPTTGTPDSDPAKPEPKKADEEAKKKTPAPGEPAAQQDAAGAAPAKEPVGDGPSLSIGTEAGPRKDEVKLDTKKTGDDDEKSRNKFAGSIFFWDHSVSTQTARVEWSPQQSYEPSYQWWFSFQPKYNFTKKFRYALRADLYKEMTNQQDTTMYRENEIGDIWNTLRYETPLSERLKHTKVSVSAQVKLPLSKASQAQGVYFKPAIGAGISQKIPINGESAKWFPGASVGFSAMYEKPIVNSTSPAQYGEFERVRQDSEGRSFVSPLLSGSMLPEHTLLTFLSSNLSITDKWSSSLSLIMINNWLYAPTEGTTIQTATGPVQPATEADPSRFSQSSWLILSTSYSVIDEMSVGLGYYNLAGIIGSNGQRRGVVGSDNIWWSPSARIFGTITAHLDKIYDRAAGIKKPEEKKASGPLSPKPVAY